MGGTEFLVCRSTLSYRGLNLAAWWGHHQINLKSYPSVNGLKLRFQNTVGSRLDIIFSKNLTLSVGSNPDFHRGWYTKEQDLIHLEWAALEAIHQEIEINRKEIWLNGQKVDISPSELDFSSLSLRGGNRDVYLSELKLFNDENLVYRTKFHAPYWHWKVMRNSFIIMIVFSFIILVLARFQLVYLFLFQFPLMLILILAIAWDYFFWSQQPLCSITSNINQDYQVPFRERFEKARFQTLSRLGQPDSTPKYKSDLFQRGRPESVYYQGPILCDPHCRLIEEEDLSIYTADNQIKKIIIFLGSSQSVGSGALRLEDTFYALALKQINREDLIFINLAKSGYFSDRLIDLYREFLQNLPPSLLIHNWGYNDNEDSIQIGLSNSLMIPRHHHVVFKEAVSPEPSPERNIQIIHQAIERMAFTHNKKLIDWNELIRQEFLKSPVEMWWDWVHLNQLGHQRAAPIFERILREELEFMDKQRAL